MSKGGGIGADALSHTMITRSSQTPHNSQYLIASMAVLISNGLDNVLMLVRDHNKEKYLTWDPKPPKSNDPLFKSWCAENNMVMTCLVNSMTVEISKNYPLATAAKEIWDSTKTRYSVKENTVAIFQVELVHHLLQKEESMTKYIVH